MHITMWTSCGSDLPCTSREGRWPENTQIPWLSDWSSWIFIECSLSWKTVKYCILSEVCMINTGSYSAFWPLMWCIKSIKGWLTHPQICWQDFVKQTCRTQKIRPDLFSNNLFSRPNLLFSRAIMALEWDLRCLYFLGVHIRLSTRCKMFPSKIT